MTSSPDDSPATPSTAVFFDIDGTLVDSNYAHVDAWSRAFVEVGHPVDSWRIHRSIGKDSSLLIAGLLGEDVPDDLVERAKEAHTRFYDEHLGDDGDLHVLARATDLLAELAGRGHSVVLATSAPENELAALRGLLDVEDALWAVTSSEDVETAKPDPGIVEVALERAGVPAARAVMVGDAVFDVMAAHRADVRCIGVLSGGFSRDELLEAGAEEVYDDVAALLDALDTSLIGRLGRE
ncbi:HAD family hydrolase [Frigoribacterium faeni]|uniref:HAD superfamily hydrolase (TIGR01509 family) n=1 Tax=Frigoribacterium faeni TaxID=145483 RepID=A0A7W3JKC1_9MICO|nr:HAD family hydrolase [Frigoribacterium faeni]MBA8814294.1 HAD superfamily hydrolase (TIGR01509 family) [Frigoribacterium faeni]GEK83234.1 haloacid dehalogenase [Frigoribacterium faeni]